MLRYALVFTLLLVVACKRDQSGAADLAEPDLRSTIGLDAATDGLDGALRDLSPVDADLSASESDLAVEEPSDLAVGADDLTTNGDLSPLVDLEPVDDLASTADLVPPADLMLPADLVPQSDLACVDPGNWKTTTVIHSDSASVGTPDSYFITTIPCTPFSASITGTGSPWTVNVSNGTSAGLYCTGSTTCAITVPPGQTTLIVTAVTTDIGNYTLTITYAIPN